MDTAFEMDKIYFSRIVKIIKKAFVECGTSPGDRELLTVAPWVNMAHTCLRRILYRQDILKLTLFRLSKYLYAEKERNCWTEGKQIVFGEYILDIPPEKYCRPSSKKINLLVADGREKELKKFLGMILSQFIVIVSDDTVFPGSTDQDENYDIIRNGKYKLLMNKCTYGIIIKKIVDMLMNGDGWNILNDGIGYPLVSRSSIGSIIYSSSE